MRSSTGKEIALFDKQIFPVLFCMLLFGAFTISSQILLLRELLIVSNGNELIIGILLGTFLLWVAAGSWLASSFLHRMKSPEWGLILVVTLSAILLPVTLFMLASTKRFLGIPTFQLINIVDLFKTAPLILAPFCAVCGGAFPMAVKTLERRRQQKYNLSIIYIAESVGSGAGALLIFLFLFPRLQPINLACLLSGMVMVGALALSLSRGRSPKLQGAFLLLLAALLLGATSERAHLLRKNIQWGTMKYLEGMSSRFGYLEALQSGQQVNIYQNGVLSATSGYYDQARSLIRIAMLQRPGAKSILSLGGCLPGNYSEILKQKQVKIDCVELNSQYISFAYKHLPAKETAAAFARNFDIHLMDVRSYTRGTRKQYDIVLLNVPPPHTLLLNRFYTREFYLALNQRLKPGGILIFQVNSSSRHLSKDHLRFLSSVKNTLDGAFGSVTMIPGDTCIFVVTNQQSFKLYEGGGGDPEKEYYYDELFRKKIVITRDALSNAVAQMNKEVEVNHDLRPIGYLYQLIQMFGRHHSRVKELLSLWISIPPRYLFIAPLAFFTALMLMSARGGRRRGVLSSAIVCAGMNGISCQILLMFAFQIRFGQLFYEIGLLTTAFMVGASLGGFISLKNSGRTVQGAGRITLAAALAIAFFPLVMRVFLFGGNWEAPAYTLFSFLNGVLTGVLFPMLALLMRPEESSSSAGKVYALDLAGACLGATLVGPLLVACLGIKDTCLWLGVINLGCFVLLVNLLRRDRARG